jgi:hypothetical protein
VTLGGGLFMSYARADEPVALRVYEALAGAGQDVWLDMAKLRPGADWQEGVRLAIDHCVGVLFLLSDESLRSTSCSQELAYAVARGKRIVPMVVDTTR